MNYHILVADDDADIVAAIEIYLRAEGYRVFPAYNGEQALRVLAEQDVHLILMDVMMPRMDGIRATMKIREQKNIPIIMLSAKGEEADKVLGLNVGADDYMTKPFSPLELVARVRSQLRRCFVLSGLPEQMLRSGGLALDDDAKQISVDGDVKALTPVEYKIVKYLLENKGRVFSSDQIYDAVWGGTAVGTDNTVAVHIRHIREKIEINPKEPKYLKVVWGLGYKIERIEPQ